MDQKSEIDDSTFRIFITKRMTWNFTIHSDISVVCSKEFMCVNVPYILFQSDATGSGPHWCAMFSFSFSFESIFRKMNENKFESQTEFLLIPYSIRRYENRIFDQYIPILGEVQMNEEGRGNKKKGVWKEKPPCFFRFM